MSEATATPPRVPATPGLVKLAVAWLLVAFVLLVYYSAWAGDDAYVTFRTVDNAVAGHGLRWNVDERVQSFTHPLWLCVLVSGRLLLADPYLVAMVASFALLGAMLVIAWKFLQGRHDRFLLFLALLYSARSFMDYACCGLENPLSFCLLSLFAWRAAPDHRRTPARHALMLYLLGAGVFVTRQDLLLLVLPTLLHLWLRVSPATLRRRVFLPLVATLPAWGWEVFSIVYYGFPFPNAAYAKLQTGVPHAALVQQGLYYLRSTVCRDPVTITVIALALLVALRSRRQADVPLALGVLCYLAYLVCVGGDFMAGRFLSPVFVVAALHLSRYMQPRCVLPAAAAAVVYAAAWPLSPAREYARPAAGFMDAHGIADERGFYYAGSALRHYHARRVFPNHTWTRRGLEFKRATQSLWACPNAGYFAYACGPGKHIIDQNALSDPLLARLPCDGPTWRVGHFFRLVPCGYAESLATGTNALCDPSLREFYDRLNVITRDPLWTRTRFRTIIDMNLGRYDHLLREYERRVAKVP